MSVRTTFSLLVALCATSGSLAAQSAAARSPAAKPEASTGSTTSIGFRAGSLGFGLELSHLLTDHVGVRVGGNFFSLSRTQTNEDVSYDATVKLKAVTGLLDWYPGTRGVFHLTAGVMSNPLTIDGVGVPSGNGTIEINNTQYTAAQIGTLTVSTKYASVLPYVGLGFGTPASSSHGIGFVFDIGAGIGKPTVGLVSSNASSVAGLQANLNAEKAKLQDNAEKLPVWPAISLGLTYRF